MAKEKETQELVIDECNVATIASQFANTLKDIPTCDQATMDVSVKNLVEFMREIPNGTAILEVLKTRLKKLVEKIDAYNKDDIKEFMEKTGEEKSIVMGGVRLTKTTKQDYDFNSDKEYNKLLEKKSNKDAEAKLASDNLKNRADVLKALIKSNPKKYGHMVSDPYIDKVSGTLL